MAAMGMPCSPLLVGQLPPLAWSSHRERARALVHRASQRAHSQRSEAFGAALRVPGEGQVLSGGTAQAS